MVGSDNSKSRNSLHITKLEISVDLCRFINYHCLKIVLSALNGENVKGSLVDGAIIN